MTGTEKHRVHEEKGRRVGECINAARLLINEPGNRLTPREFVARAQALIALDGESNWLEGALLIIVYVILAVSFFEFQPPV